MKKAYHFTFLLATTVMFFNSVRAHSFPQASQVHSDSVSMTVFRTDSNQVESYIKSSNVNPLSAQQIRQFYMDRKYHHAWVTEDGISEHAQVFLDLYNQFQFYSGDSTLQNPDLSSNVELVMSEGINIDSLKNYAQMELQLTDFFISFIKRAYMGRVDPEKFFWHIPRKKLNIAQLLNEIALSNDLASASWLPISEEYKAIRAHVLRLKSINQMHWDEVVLPKSKIFRHGDTSAVIKTIKNRLLLLGDLETADTTGIFDENLVQAVEGFQKRHGLNVDAIIGPNFMEAINIPIDTKLKKMLINMERMRWMPAQESGKKVVVNIPAFKMNVYQDGNPTLTMAVVVGKAATRTVIFSDHIKHVVFSPYWNLPMSIVENEVLPGIELNVNYIKDHNMEIRGERNGLPIVRQKPGQGNALGRVKFIFPNKYSIYLHDTPSRQLFNQTTRAFSHGCIRVEDPFALASNLLSPLQEWTPKSIKDAMSSNTEKWVALKDAIPVYITYFTSWVDSSGKLNFRKDIYGHDQRLAARLFKDQ